MNEFSFINENNTRFSLRDFSQKAFIPSVSGLGYKNNLTFVKVGNLYKTDNKEIAQGTLSGTAIFSSYEHYRDFVNYVESSESLRLIYKPIDVEYFRDVEFGGVPSPTKKGGLVEAEISLLCKGLYYTQTDTRFTIEEVTGQSQYDLLFDYTFNDYASVNVVFDNVGHADAQMVVEFYGYFVNPKIELIQNDVVIRSVDFNITVEVGEKLIYSAQDGQNYVVLDNGISQVNAVSSLSLNSDNFFQIPKGTSKIVCSSDGGTFTKIVFRILTSYKGV